jgi:glyoxylase-like metal-dependent hydrolase (beta-lactamase superfamily II)
LPINVYVIEHEQGLMLFDTGQDRASVTDADYFPRGIIGWFYGRLTKFRIDRHDTLTAALLSIGYNVADVRWAVLSHLHQDHIGGLGELKSAEIIVSADEWRSLRRRDATLQGLMRNHIDLPGLRWRFIRFQPGTAEAIGDFDTSVDLLGDGSVCLVSTPGHTPGSVSLLVRREGKVPLLMVGDVTYDVALMHQERVPGVGRKAELRSATRSINNLRAVFPDLVVLPAHDTGAADRLAAAERRLD